MVNSVYTVNNDIGAKMVEDFKPEAINSLAPLEIDKAIKAITFTSHGKEAGFCHCTYRCRDCGQEQEVLVRVSKRTPIFDVKCFNDNCPSCGYDKLTHESERENSCGHRDLIGKIISEYRSGILVHIGKCCRSPQIFVSS